MIEHHKDSADSKDRKPYCGLLYQQGLLEFTNDEATQRAFAAGFVSGQTEKVHSGSCPAAMFCPVSDDHAWFYRMVSDVARRYGLEADRLLVWASKSDPPEIWVHRRRTPIGQWLEFPVNSERWHEHRAIACGIPREEIDTHFHQRKSDDDW